MEMTYTQRGNILIPNLTVAEQTDKTPIGKYGMMRKAFLKEHKPALYGSMILAGELQTHLKETDRQAREQIELIISKQAKVQGVNEDLKENDPMKWTGLMNSIKQQAEEEVLSNLIYK